MRIVWVLLALTAGELFGGAAAAADCKFKPGDYVGVAWAAETNVPAVILSVLDNCRYEFRFIARPGEAYFLYPQTTNEVNLVPLDGPPPYDNPFGCPFRDFEPVDIRAEGDWRRGMVTTVLSDCTLQSVYVNAAGAAMPRNIDQFSYADVRPAQLTPLTLEEVAALLEQTKELATCPVGDDPAGFGEGPDGVVKHRIVEALDGQYEESVTVRFEGVRKGTEATITGDVLQLYPDAAIGGTLTPFRADVRYCVETKPLREDHHMAIDYHCYPDAFGDTVCKQFGSKPLP